MTTKRNLILFLCMMLCRINIYCNANHDSLCKVVNIRVKGDYYVIIVNRNDTLYKIISKRVQPNNPDLEPIKRGGYYYLKFGNSDENNNEKTHSTLSGIANYLDIKKTKPVFREGNTRIRFTKRFHYRLYVTKNLIGFYYVPNAP